MLFGITPDLTCFGKIIGGGLPVGAFGGRKDIMDMLAPLGSVYQAGTLSGNPLAMAAGIAALQELQRVGDRSLSSPSAAFSPLTPALSPLRGEGEEDDGRSAAYDLLEALGRQLESGMRDAARSAKVDVQFVRIGSMFCGYFTSEPVHNLEDAMKSDRARFAKFFHGMLAQGIYLAPSQFEAGFISTAHTESDIARTTAAAAVVLRTL